MDYERLDRHRLHVGICHTTLGILGLLASIVLGVLGFMAGGQGKRHPEGVVDGDLLSGMGLVLCGVGCLGLFFSLPGLLGGLGLLRRSRGAKNLVMVAGLLQLPNFPVGTLVGIYTLWFTFQREVDVVFDKD